MDLREQRPPIFTNRACIQKTFLEKGLDYISDLALENCKALAGVIQWNHEKGIRLFRRGAFPQQFEALSWGVLCCSCIFSQHVLVQLTQCARPSRLGVMCDGDCLR